MFLGANAGISRMQIEGLIADADDELAADHIEPFILGLMVMQRRAAF